VIVAHDDPDQAWAAFRNLFGQPIEGVDVVGVEVGRRHFNAFGEDVEHFGYVDGRSQPLFFAADVEREALRNRLSDWNPGFAPRQVLVRSGGGGYGSYLVFRKLQQNLLAFDAAKRRAAARRGSPPDPAAAGASIVGRYEDGRPAGLLDHLPSVLPVENGFGYDREPPACPLGSHVRLMNPRTSRDRGRAIARRGLPYAGHAYDTGSAGSGRRSADGGLLFMAYMADIGAQFEALQLVANGSGGGPRDPLISQGGGGPATAYTRAGDSGAREMPLVELRGGEYFFVPPLDLLREDLTVLGDRTGQYRPAMSDPPVGSPPSRTYP
jgi:Dyp-type peroxidase family